MFLGNLFGTERDNQEHVALGPRHPNRGRPARDQTIGEFIGPLAIIQYDQSGTIFGTECVEKTGQRIQHPDLSGSFRALGQRIRLSQNTFQTRQGGTDSRRLLTQSIANALQETGIGVSGTKETIDEAIQQRERSSRDVVRALSPHQIKSTPRSRAA